MDYRCYRDDKIINFIKHTRNGGIIWNIIEILINISFDCATIQYKI